MDIAVNWDMQENKFPPNTVFLLYTGIIIPWIALFSKEIHRVLCRLDQLPGWRWVFQQYQDSCYSIFLIHPLAFWCVSKVISKVTGADGGWYHAHLWTLPLVWLAIIVLAAGIGHVFSRIERLRVLRI